jgi:hypothetical protein
MTKSVGASSIIADAVEERVHPRPNSRAFAAIR